MAAGAPGPRRVSPRRPPNKILAADLHVLPQAIIFYGLRCSLRHRWGVVQSVGHLTVNEDGVGSSPTAPGKSFAAAGRGGALDACIKRSNKVRRIQRAAGVYVPSVLSVLEVFVIFEARMRTYFRR